MKATELNQRIDLVNEKLDALDGKQKAIYDFTKHIGDNYVNTGEVWALENRVKALEKIIETEFYKEPKVAYNFLFSFIIGLQVTILISIIILNA